MKKDLNLLFFLLTLPITILTTWLVSHDTDAVLIAVDACFIISAVKQWVLK